MVNDDVRDWRASGKHLPNFMRDFHHQKDLFKAIGPGKTPSGREIDWITAHCYTIDRFLWFMARHGYVLRKTSAKLSFDDIETTLSEITTQRRELEGTILKAFFSKSE